MKDIKKKEIVYICIILFFLSFIKVKAFETNINYYIYSKGCLSCQNLEKYIKTKEDIKRIEINESNIENIKVYILENYNIEKLSIPTLIYNNKVYIGEKEIKDFFYIKESSIFLLGFIDGLNPCAISILMIFCSFLLISNKKNKMIFIGLSFILGETILNFLLGVSILKITNFTNQFEKITKIIYIITLIMCIYIIIINSIDIKNGIQKKKEIKNILSFEKRSKIIEIISKNIDSKCLMIISFIMGSIIAILEFGCTGQIYLPTILALDKISINSIISLMKYNLMFALPLIIFLILSLIIQPEKIRDKIMEYSYILKIFMNIVLFLLFFVIFNKL